MTGSNHNPSLWGAGFPACTCSPEGLRPDGSTTLDSLAAHAIKLENRRRKHGHAAAIRRNWTSGLHRLLGSGMGDGDAPSPGKRGG